MIPELFEHLLIMYLYIKTRPFRKVGRALEDGRYDQPESPKFLWVLEADDSCRCYLERINLVP
jgi:hypothetical protein